jgi:hypothetical protein
MMMRMSEPYSAHHSFCFDLVTPDELPLDNPGRCFGLPCGVRSNELTAENQRVI